MASLLKRIRYSEFFRIFNFKSDRAAGRCMLLINTFSLSVANIYINGVLYTGFLTIAGIDIVRVGIIAFIPYLTWWASIFSPVILARFKRRRALLIFNHIFYYLCVVVATTAVPFFVEGSAARTLWFAVFLLAGNLLNALLGSGCTAWHINFLPDGYDRNLYFSYTTLVSSVTGTVLAIVSSLSLDAIADVSLRGNVITVMRLAASVIFIANGLALYLVPREYPYALPQKKLRVLDIIRVPLGQKRFMLTALVVIFWNFISNVNANTWNYYVLNTVGIGYTYMFIGSVTNAVCGIFLLRYWRKAMIRFSSYSVLIFTIFNTGLLELAIGFSTSRTVWVFVIVTVLQGLNSVGTNLVFANLFYMNLPEGHTDVYTTFWNFAANISVFFGSVCGTWFISFAETRGPWTLFGLPFYGSQFLVWIKFALFMLLCVYLIKFKESIKNN